MSHVRTLSFTPSFVERDAVTLTSATPYDNAGLGSYFTRSSRPAYNYTIRMDALTKQQAESLSAVHAYHQGGKSFFWDGGPFGSIEDFRLLAEGDNTRRDFFLGNRNRCHDFFWESNECNAGWDLDILCHDNACEF